MFRRRRRTVGNHLAPAAPTIPARFILARQQDGETRFCRCGEPLSVDAPLALRVYVLDGHMLRGLCGGCARECDPALALLAGEEASGNGPGVPRELVQDDSFLLLRVVRPMTVTIPATR